MFRQPLILAGHLIRHHKTLFNIESQSVATDLVFGFNLTCLQHFWVPPLDRGLAPQVLLEIVTYKEVLS